MFDISAVGAKVIINTTYPKLNAIEITHFSDEGTPFECPDVDFTTNQKNLNGDMISSRTPSVYTISVTVIPGSKEDLQLTQFAQANCLQPRGVVPVGQLSVNQIVLSVPKISESAEVNTASHMFVWVNGRLKSGPTGPSTSADGRLSARTFTFEMEGFVGPSGTGDDIGRIQQSNY